MRMASRGLQEIQGLEPASFVSGEMEHPSIRPCYRENNQAKLNLNKKKTQQGRNKTNSNGTSQSNRKKFHMGKTNDKEPRNEGIGIPTPIRKFKTTNPSTLSPTYHLLYDLTSPTTSDVNNVKPATNNNFTSKPSHLIFSPQHTVSQTSNPPCLTPSHPSLHTANLTSPLLHSTKCQPKPSAVGESNTPIAFWDGSMALVSLPVPDNYTNNSHLDIASRNTDNTLVSLAKQRHTSYSPSTTDFRFSQTTHAKRDGDDKSSNNNSHLGCNFITSYKPRPTALPGPSETTVLEGPKFEYCDVKTQSADATGISDCQTSKAGGNTDRPIATCRLQPEPSRFNVSVLPVETGRRQEKDSVFLSDAFYVGHRPSDKCERQSQLLADFKRDSESFPNSNGLAVNDVIDLYKRNPNQVIDKHYVFTDNHSHSDTESKECVQRNKTISVKNHLTRVEQTIVSDSNTLKNVVFQCEGDSLRLFLTGDNLDVRSDVVRDRGQFQNSQKQSKNRKSHWHQDLVSANHQSAKINRSTDCWSKAKQKSENKKPSILTKVLSGSSNTTTKNADPNLSKKPVNRWDTIHVNSLQTVTNVSNVKDPSGQTKGLLSLPSALYDKLSIEAFKDQDVPFRSTDNERVENKGKVNRNQHTTPATVIRGILVNKDTGQITNRTSGSGSKVNSVQFIDDTNILKPYSSFRESELGISTAPPAVREVIDRNKYIIKPREVTSIPHRSNQSHDSFLQPSSVFASSLDNTVISPDQDKAGVDQLQTLGTSITSDTRGQSRKPSSLSPPGEIWPSQKEATTTSNTDCHLATPSGGSRRKHHLVPECQQKSYNLNKQSHQTSFSNHTENQEDLSALQGGLEASVINICEDIFSLGNGHTLSDQRVQEILSCPFSSTVHNYDGQPSELRSSGINFPSAVHKEEEEIAGEETFTYRKNLRDVCQKNLLLNLHHVEKDSAWIKSSRENQELNSNPTVVVLNRGEQNGNNQNSSIREQDKQVKVTPRQKFEIRHNKICEKVASNLRNRKEETEQVGTEEEDKGHNEDINLFKSYIASNLTLDIYKESPRARFERDRAARAFAIVNNGLSPLNFSHEKLNLSCDDLDKKTSTFSKSSTSEFHLNPETIISPDDSRKTVYDLKLSPRARFESRRLLSHSINSQLVEVAIDDVDGQEKIDSETKVDSSIRFHWSQQPVKRKAENISEFVQENQQHKNQSTRSFELTDQPAPKDQRFCSSGVKSTFSSATHSFHGQISVDTDCRRPTGITGAEWLTEGAQNSSPDLPIETVSGPVIPTRDKGSVYFHKAGEKPLAGSGIQKVSAKDVLLLRNSFVTDTTTKYGSHPVQSGNPGPETKPKDSQSAEPQHSSVGKKMSPGSVSSSGYESEINSSVLNQTHRSFSGTNQKVHDFNSKSTVQELRLRFGHLTLKSVKQPKNESGHQLVLNPAPIQHLIVSKKKPNLLTPITSFPQSHGLKDKNKNSDFPNNNKVLPDSNQNSQLSRGNNQSSPRSLSQSDVPVDISSVCVISHSPIDRNKKKLDKVNRSMNGIIQDLNPEGCGKPNCKRLSQNNNCSKSHRRTYSYLPNKGEGEARHNSESSDYISCEHSSNHCLITQGYNYNSANNKGGEEKGRTEIRLSNNSNTNNNKNIDNDSHIFYQGDSNMLASKGLRIYESGEEYVAMRSPVKSPLQKSLSAPQFQWEGASYLIMPTVVETFTHNKNNGPGHVTHRSISDSGTSADLCHLNSQENERNAIFSNSNSDGDEHSESYLSMSPLDGRLNMNQRAMSVDVLCAEDVSSNPNWNNPRSSALRLLAKKREENQNGGRGYVEWKTCSGWVGKTDMRNADGRNSRGYVEWDTIWTAAAPWGGDQKDDEHVYDVIAEEDLSQSCDKNLPSLGFEHKTVTSVTLDTPPALPERTYINRLKNNNNNSPESRTQNLHHSSHVPHSSCKKHSHCHHRHHHHHHHTKHRNGQNSTSDTLTTSSSLSFPSSHQLSKQKTRTTSSSSNITEPTQLVMDESQNYAQVHKLKGYKFSSLMTLTDSPLSPQPDQKAAHSENYWHLAPVTSQERVTNWQTGDVLDYIDGLHDSMSPKRRENIYILLNNKKTRAKFSESLEIESRLMSKGLITTSTSSCEGEKDSTVVNIKDDFVGGDKNVTARHGVIKRKGATAPVSSTYV